MERLFPIEFAMYTISWPWPRLRKSYEYNLSGNDWSLNPKQTLWFAIVYLGPQTYLYQAKAPLILSRQEINHLLLYNNKKKKNLNLSKTQDVF